MTKRLTQDAHDGSFTLFGDIDEVAGYLDDHPDFAADDWEYVPEHVGQEGAAIVVYDSEGYRLGLI
jgi:hypothetical protein